MFVKSLGISLKNYKINPVIRALIYSDFLYWSAGNLIAPLFSVFVVSKLTDGSLETVGIAVTLSLLTRALAEIPFSMIIDKWKGEFDEMIFMAIGGIMGGLSFILLPFVTDSGGLYLLQILNGLGYAISNPAWYSIFTRHIDKNEEAFEWSLYDVLISLGMAVASAVGGFVATRYGFDIIFYTVGILNIISGFVPLTIKKYLYKMNVKN